jgi:DNA-binding PadR family transcriptional regulator
MLPKITHLQAFVIQLIASGDHSGRFIRSRLEEIGEQKSEAAFYQLMARMEQAGLVAGNYLVSVINGQTIKERRYHATIQGMTEFLAAEQFYSQAKRKSRIPEPLQKALLSSKRS